MKLTVVIPVYNNEEIYDELKEKILKVSENGEVIIIDDCSIDNTFSRLSKFIEDEDLSQVKIYKNSKNMGPSFSRNVGIKKARGKYIAFLDSDDDWHPQKIQLQLQLMEQYDVKICGTMHKVISRDDLKQENSIDYLKFKDISLKEIKWPGILFVTPFATPSVIIEKSLKNYLFDETMKYAEDYNMWKRITYKHKAIKILEPLTYTFKHDYISNDSCLSSNLKKMQDGVNESFIKLMKEKDIGPLYKILILLALFFSNIKYIRRLIINKRHS